MNVHRDPSVAFDGLLVALLNYLAVIRFSQTAMTPLML